MEIIFKKTGKEFIAEAEEGSSILEIAQKNNIELHGNCGGFSTCGSCHIILEDEFIKLTEESSDQENDVLDMIFGVEKNSRLACQVFFKQKMNGMKITIPE